VTPHNRVLVVVGGAAVIASLAIALVFVQTNAADQQLGEDQIAAHDVQALGDALLIEVHGQHQALDEYLLSGHAGPLAAYRQAVVAETIAADKISATSSNLPGVADALAAVDAENDAWRAQIADPAIAAVQGGSPAALAVAIQIQTDDHHESQAATAALVVKLDDVVAQLSARSTALDGLRGATTAFGVVIELLAAGLSLLFVRRYGVAISRDQRRRERDGAERLQIIASLRTLRTEATPEGTAAVIAGALNRLPGVDAAGVLEWGPDGLVAIAMDGVPDFPIRTGDTFPEEMARYLLERSGAGPWGEAWTEFQPGALGEGLALMGIKSGAFAPVLVDGETIALIGLVTTDSGNARHLVEDLPAIGEFASVAESILAPALMARRGRLGERRRIAATIESAAFRPVFQPVIDLATGAIVGFEALTRFDDGCRPDVTFAAALACGMGFELETVTLEAALREARALAPATWLSLNVSPPLLAQTESVARLLAGTTRAIVLEVTEHVVIDDYAPLREAMRQLGPGVRLAVDDAGAGAANFTHLVELRPQFVKIDAGLVRGLDGDPSRRAVVVGLVHFAAESGCQVIAEGIETEAERATLTELGVTLGQGYLLARPAPAATWTPGAVATGVVDAELIVTPESAVDDPAHDATPPEIPPITPPALPPTVTPRGRPGPGRPARLGHRLVRPAPLPGAA
jgi:EAL domain-containing protein (putative c-di-GMP-specific phosphodiesterase class I)